MPVLAVTLSGKGNPTVAFVASRRVPQRVVLCRTTMEGASLPHSCRCRLSLFCATLHVREALRTSATIVEVLERNLRKI